MPVPRKIIIDTDPGQDDAVAILLALGSSELDILGITAVAGNVPLKLTENNARKICELAGRPDIKVYSGAIRPLIRELVTAEEVHGKTGLNGPDLPEPTMKLQEQHAVDYLVETLMREEAGTITLCPLGPLTNVALALIREPRIAPRIKEIVLMGGGFFEGGNVTPAAEFNIYVDPHAADVVFRSGVPIVMMPLDVTHKALTTTKRIDAFRKLGTKVGLATAQMLEFFERYDEGKYGTDGGPLHDPCVIAYLLKPELFQGRHCNVTVETSSELTMGMTVIDWWGVTKRPKNAMVMRDIDHDGFFALLVERLGRLWSRQCLDEEGAAHGRPFCIADLAKDLPRPRKRQPDAAADKERARDAGHQLEAFGRQELAGAACGNRVGRIRHRREDHRCDAHDDDLLGVVGARVDELRDEGAEEDQRLGVADRNQEALQEKAAARPPGRAVGGELASRAEHLNAEPDQIGGAQKPDPLEPVPHRLDHLVEADADDGDHHGDADLRAGGVGEAGARAMPDAGRDDQRDRRPRYQHDDDAGDDIGGVEFKRHVPFLRRSPDTKHAKFLRV